MGSLKWLFSWLLKCFVCCVMLCGVLFGCIGRFMMSVFGCYLVSRLLIVLKWCLWFKFWIMMSVWVECVSVLLIVMLICFLL